MSVNGRSGELEIVNPNGQQYEAHASRDRLKGVKCEYVETEGALNSGNTTSSQTLAHHSARSSSVAPNI